MIFIFLSHLFAPDSGSNNNAASQDKLESLTKQLQQEKLLKMQAVNKLAEIMNRKDMNISNKKQKQNTSADLRKKEKECRKLQQDLNLVRVCVASPLSCERG
jgi:predicted ATP-dependent protease